MTVVDLFEVDTHSFVIKIWLEETAEEAGHVTWRGQITHVPSGEKRYVQELPEISRFIWSFLEKMGVKSGLKQKFLLYLNL